jgi:carbon-monoxide dehydrogenase medium subunit
VKPPAFAYAAPDALSDALELLAEHGDDAKVLAGGQSLTPMLNLRLARPSALIDLNRVAALTGIERDGPWLRVRSMTRQLELQRSPVDGISPLVGQALRFVGHVATRGRGTVGGSLVHADPAAELPAVLLVLDGEVVVASVRGQRTIAAADLFVRAFETSLGSDEVLVEIRLPVRPQARCGFVEFARRHGDFALAGAAVEVELDEAAAIRRVGIGLFGIADVARRMPDLERDLIGRTISDPRIATEVASAVSRAVDPGDDIHATGTYRKRVAGIAAARALSAAGDARAGTP